MDARINRRIFKMIFLLLIVLAFVVGTQTSPLLHYSRDRDSRPERNETPATENRKEQPLVDHYDQRQNGSENYRVKVDGVVFILAPADTLLLGAALEPNYTSLFSDLNRPKPKPEKDDFFGFKPSKLEKEDMQKSAHHENTHFSHKPALRISNLIAPFLNRIRHVQQATK